MKARRYEKIGSGWIPANRRKWKGGMILFCPNAGFVRIAFGTGDNLTGEDCDLRDPDGNRIDDYVYIQTYDHRKTYDGSFTSARIVREGDTERPVLSGLFCEETDGAQLLISHKSHPDGDLRDFIRPALEMVGFPTRPGGLYLVNTQGAFNWNGAPAGRAR